MTRDCPVQFGERLEGKFLRPTQLAIFASSPRSAERILESLVKWLKKELKLEVNLEKSGTGSSGGSSLLGFRIYEDGRIGIAPKVITKLK